MEKVLILFFLLLGVSLRAQDKVVWDFSYNSKAGSLELKATVAEGWHLYSQNISNEIGPVPTSFTFQPNSQVKLVGTTEEPVPIKEYDENFEAMLNFFKGEVVFRQKVEFESIQILEGTVTFMVCNDTMCLPPTDLPFKIELKPIN